MQRAGLLDGYEVRAIHRIGCWPEALGIRLSWIRLQGRAR